MSAYKRDKFGFSFQDQTFFQSIRSPKFTHYYAAMKSIIEALARNSSCSNLTLNYDVLFLLSASVFDMLSVEMYSEYYAVVLITFCKHIKKVAFYDFFQFHYSYPHFACALRYNTNIQEIDLSRNQMMNEKAIVNIAEALACNETVKMVIFGAWLSLDVFLCHFAFKPPVRSGLNSVVVASNAIPREEVIRAVHLVRMLSGQQLSEHPFSVIRYVEANMWTPSHYVVYTGFGAHTVGLDRTCDEGSYESGEYSDSDSYFGDCISHFENENHECSYESDKHSDSDGDSASYFGDWVSHLQTGSDECSDGHN